MLFSNSQILFHAPIIRILGNFLGLLSGSKENWGPGWAVGGWVGWRMGVQAWWSYMHKVIISALLRMLFFFFFLRASCTTRVLSKMWETSSPSQWFLKLCGGLEPTQAQEPPPVQDSVILLSSSFCLPTSFILSCTLENYFCVTLRIFCIQWLLVNLSSSIL